MKPCKIVLTALLCFAGFSSLNAHAGIPVIDPTAIASSIQSAVQSYTQAVEQYKVLQQQYAQMQKLESISSGSRGLNLANTPQVLSNISPDLGAAMSNIKNSPTFAKERAKYPTSTDAKTNEFYDQSAIQKATVADFLSRSAARVKELQTQKAQYDTATDPAGRAEAANAMAANKAIIDADNESLRALQAQQEQQRKDALFALNKRNACLQFSRPSQVANCQ